ncbi:MAG: hypothetical protein JRI22_12590 [Deltaproteobacteria bacterium]|nr:hypothetical protein [Deltaproteobacteria bacterium]
MAVIESGKILELAVRMETIGRAFYESLAAKADDEGIRGLFNMLAVEEKAHQEIFEKMKAREGVFMTHPAEEVEEYYQVL